ncbi:hypothetical protein [Halarcobacter anaerophilus]|uniref:Uncharacterized protein n=1 Tax=Halarcobacter anaerophilus TaxID=877500 RepID=A0A4Q0Y5G6_9BACT|nr:hypothetical protein [Halarcobacter anaerophilus]QDF28956.1 hypothetical protein AANAER_1476 [Halarcobacter anaerophilus]RXJ63591.1 hypothetical protein CRV06_05205 [Halarcobacter anaerophilus]
MISSITAMGLFYKHEIQIPKMPKEFVCERLGLEMTEKNIKDFSKDHNVTYTLDYINKTVVFEDR